MTAATVRVPPWHEPVRWGSCCLAVAVLHVGIAVGLMSLSPVLIAQPSDAPSLLIDMSLEVPSPVPEPAEQIAAEPPPVSVPPARELVQPREPPTPPADLAPVETPPVAEPAPPPPIVDEAEAVLPLPPRPVPPTPARRKTAAKPAPIRPLAKPSVAAAEAVAPPVVKPSTTPPDTRAASGTAAAQASSSWQSRLVAHINHFKRYPPEAEMRHQEGVVTLRFVMDRAGHVRAFRLINGSGYDLLDAEAQALLPRADPLPALPPEIAGEAIELVIPLRFHIQ